MGIKEDIESLAHQRDARIQREQELTTAARLQDQQEERERIVKEARKEAVGKANSTFSDYIYQAVFYPTLVELEASLNQTKTSNSNPWKLMAIGGISSYAESSDGGYDEDGHNWRVQLPHHGYALTRLSTTRKDYEEDQFLIFTLKRRHAYHTYDLIFAGEAGRKTRVSLIDGYSKDSGVVS